MGLLDGALCTRLDKLDPTFDRFLWLVMSVRLFLVFLT